MLHIKEIKIWEKEYNLWNKICMKDTEDESFGVDSETD